VGEVVRGRSGGEGHCGARETVWRREEAGEQVLGGRGGRENRCGRGRLKKKNWGQTLLMIIRWVMGL